MGRVRTDTEQTVIRRTYDGGLVRLHFEARLLNFDAVLARAKDLRPFFQAVNASGAMAKPESFERPDRMRGGLGVPDKDGKRRNWGRGYQYKFGRTKRTASWRDRRGRPFGPRTTQSFEVRGMVEPSLVYIVTGDLPT